MLNLLWIIFFILAFVASLYQALFLGHPEIYNEIIQAMFAMAKTAFEISLGLTGVLSLWLGIMKIAEKSGFITLLTHVLSPLFTRLMPEIPKHHPALGAITMNMAANALGLDNAATPLGIKAMHELQRLNPEPDKASNAQILFLVINTSAVTLFPITIFTYRAQMGANNPTDVFIPILIATYVSTLAGLIAVAIKQQINLFNRTILAYMSVFTAGIVAIVTYFSSLEQVQMLHQSAIISNFILFSLVITFLCGAIYTRTNAYEAFIEGAKEGFNTAITIIPYLLAMLVAIAVFRASGVLGFLAELIKFVVLQAGLDTQFVDALPTAFMKPFSGSGARAMMVDAMQTHGVDSLPGRIAATVQGSTETTFYVLAVYFGAVGIKNIRYAALCGIIADFFGILAAIIVAYWFFT